MKTDSQLQQNVIVELAWEPSVNAEQIGVEVQCSIVTLAGRLDSGAVKGDAERAAQRVQGVKGLAVELEVTLPVPSQRSDADIARAAANVLSWLSYLPADSVKVLVEEGLVTLTGQVHWEFERRGAAEIVRQLMGVAGVNDQIAIAQKVSGTLVQADIEAALKRRTHNDAQMVGVRVKGADVTLLGTVQSWGERDLANHAAWSALGVRHVVDDIAVAY